MIHNLNNFVNESLGSSLNFSAHGWWGKEKNLSAIKSVRPKVLGAKPKQAGKKEGGWGEGIFARPSDWILKFGIRILLKKCSNFVQKTPHFDALRLLSAGKACQSMKKVG